MRKKVDKNETPRQRFVRLCNSRVNTVLKRLNVLSYLADPRRYEFSQRDIDMIEKALREKLDYLVRKFRDQSKPEKGQNEFQLEL